MWWEYLINDSAVREQYGLTEGICWKIWGRTARFENRCDYDQYIWRRLSTWDSHRCIDACESCDLLQHGRNNIHLTTNKQRTPKNKLVTNIASSEEFCLPSISNIGSIVQPGTRKRMMQHKVMLQRVCHQSMRGLSNMKWMSSIPKYQNFINGKFKASPFLAKHGS